MGDVLRRSCELCDAEAYVYCLSDSAFLCRTCDEKVHCVNFLVARHLRVHIHPQCWAHAEKNLSSVGVLSKGNMEVTCRSCSCSCSPQVENEDCLSSSSSSSCVSSTTGEEVEAGVTSSSSTSSRRNRINRRISSRGRSTVVVDMKVVKGVLVNWCRILGVEDTRVVQTAVELISMGKITKLPLHVSLAAALWVAIRLRTPRIATCHNLKRLEQISGVPAKLITRVNKRRQSREDHEEGWAEC